MAVHIVDVSFDPKGDPLGRMVWRIDDTPVPDGGVIVHRGDTVQWRSKEGDLIVNFQTGQPFGHRTFKAAAGQLTDPPAVVHANAPRPQSFICEITLRGRTQAISGVDVQPPP